MTLCSPQVFFSSKMHLRMGPKKMHVPAMYCMCNNFKITRPPQVGSSMHVVGVLQVMKRCNPLRERCGKVDDTYTRGADYIFTASLHRSKVMCVKEKWNGRVLLGKHHMHRKKAQFLSAFSAFSPHVSLPPVYRIPIWDLRR